VLRAFSINWPLNARRCFRKYHRMASSHSSVEIGEGSEALSDYLSKLAEDNGIMPPVFEPVGAEEQGKLDRKKEIVCPSCGNRFVP